jgi:hypothetical protein
MTLAARRATGRIAKAPNARGAGLLPFLELTWQDFERLCLHISERGGMVQAAWAYGGPMRTASNRMS